MSSSKRVSKILNLLDNEDDLAAIDAALQSYIGIIDHLQGNGFQPHPAPDCMNRHIITTIEKRVQFLCVKRLAIELKDHANTKTKLTSEVSRHLPKRLDELGICATDRTKWGTIRRWIYADASETYPPA